MIVRLRDEISVYHPRALSSSWARHIDDIASGASKGYRLLQNGFKIEKYVPQIDVNAVNRIQYRELCQIKMYLKMAITRVVGSCVVFTY